MKSASELIKDIETGNLDLRNANGILYFQIDNRMFPVQRIYSTGKDSLRVRYVAGGGYQVPIVKGERVLVQTPDALFFVYAHRVLKVSATEDGVPVGYIDLYDLSAGTCTPKLDSV